MHLMYTLDENGNRVYTLKVSPVRLTLSCVSNSNMNLPQKITDSGKITRSAHPGMALFECTTSRIHD